MTQPSNPNKGPKGHHLLLRIVLCSLILLAGLGGLFALAALKKPPAEISEAERPLKVTVRRVRPQSIPIVISGYGQVKALNTVQISAEVAGRVVAVHPRLESGEVIKAGDILFGIDPRTYAAALAQGEAEVAQWRSVVKRLEQQSAADQRRLITLERSRDLARAEFDRIADLFRRHSVGTQSGVDRAEQAFNAATDQADQMAQAVTLYPTRIKEATSSLAGAKARLGEARVNVERCQVRAPFTGRLTLAAVEKGQYVTPGTPLVAMADDTLLEIQVSLESHEVRRWMRFSPGGSTGNWFGQPEPVACRVRWTEDTQGYNWSAQLHRVVAFDEKTRTVTVAVRIAAEQTDHGAGLLPLVEGMFCLVEIPGKTLHGAMQVPRKAVSFNNTVYLAVDRRLKTVDVEVAKIDDDMAYITGGLSNGDLVITTRLVDPLENTLLEPLPENDSRGIEQGKTS
jgi:multidrug efflux system membrane fusion protein